MTMPTRKAFAKIVLSAILIALVLRATNTSKLLTTFRDIPPAELVLIIAIYTFGQLMSSYKWWLIARSGGVETRWPVALRAYFAGMFVNCFGLGIVGGDVARGILLADGGPRKAQCFASVVADRLHGLSVLALIGAASLLIFGVGDIQNWLVGVIVAVFAIGLGFWFFGPTLLLKIIKPGSRFRSKAEEVSAVFPRSATTILWITLISFIFHSLQISLHFLMANALGFSLSARSIFTYVPFINILCSLPLSWNGLGVREKSYQFFFASSGLSAEQAVGLGFIWLFAVTINSAVGGLFAFLAGDLKLLRKKQAR